MDETDKANIIAAALALGFTVSDHDELKCTHDQLYQFAGMVAASAIEQFIQGVKNGQS